MINSVQIIFDIKTQGNKVNHSLFIDLPPKFSTSLNKIGDIAPIPANYYLVGIETG